MQQPLPECAASSFSLRFAASFSVRYLSPRRVFLKMLFVSLFVRLLPSILPNYRNDFSQRWQSVFFFCVGVKIDVNISKGFAT